MLQRKELRLPQVDWKAQITRAAGGGTKMQILSPGQNPPARSVCPPLSIYSWFPDGECHCLDHLTTIFVAYVFIICSPQKASSPRAGTLLGAPSHPRN